VSTHAIASFLVLCVAAASAPAWAPRVSPREPSGQFPGWPALLPPGWSQVALDPTEAAYTERFPGRVARFQNGQQQLVVRYIEQPSRRVHPSSHCLAASGYDLQPAPMGADGPHQVGAWIATRGAQRMRVEEWVVSADGQQHSDVTAWFWSAILGYSRGPWVAYTRSTPLPRAGTPSMGLRAQ
jgi:hypothetical protein